MAKKRPTAAKKASPAAPPDGKYPKITLRP
jgi:hypothetical protein